MRDIVKTYVEKFRTDRRKSRRTTSLVLALALLVIAGVFWQLHYTGIALTNETYCGMDEHTHSEECYEQVLICGFEESESVTETIEGHTHSEECYELQLVCGLEEHTHSIDCMSDETADTETMEDWEETLPTLSGILAEDVVAVAESQFGYVESTQNYVLAQDGETRQGYTRYGAWYGEGFEYVDWDAMFASFCLYYAGVDTNTFPLSSGAYAWTAVLSSLERYTAAADADPAAGDLIFFDEDGDGRADRVGIVTAVEKEEGTVSAAATEESSVELTALTVTEDIDDDNDTDDEESAGNTSAELAVIEGDCENADGEDAVVENTYTSDDSTILGYGILTEQETETTASATLLAVAAVEDETEETADEEDEIEEDETEDATYTVEEVQELVDALPSVDDLFDYFDGLTSKTDETLNLEDSLGSDGSISYTIYNSDKTSVKESDGVLQLVTDTTYLIGLTISVPKGLTAGTYTYDGLQQYADTINFQNGTGTITNSSTGDEIGSWSVDSDGLITLTMNEASGSSQDLNVGFSISVTFKETTTTTTIGDSYVYVSKAVTLSVNKSGSRVKDAPFETSGTDTYLRWDILFSGMETVEGTVLYDYLYQTDSAADNPDGTNWIDSDCQTYGVTFVAIDSNGVTHCTWTVYGRNNDGLEWLDRDGDGIIDSWRYTMPASVNGVKLDASWSYTASYYTERLPADDSNTYVRYRNAVQVKEDSTTVEDTHTLADSYGGIYANKEYAYGDDNLTVVWKTTFTIEANTVAQSENASFVIQDVMKIYSSDYQTIDAELLTSDFISNVTITIKEGDEKYTAIADTDTENVANATYVYSIYYEETANTGVNNYVENETNSSKTKNVYFFIAKQKCTCGSDCSCMSSGSGYCSCWTEDVTITLTYETDKVTMIKLMGSDYAAAGDYVQNYAALYTYNVSSPSSTLLWKLRTSDTAYVPLLLASKKITKEVDESTGDYTVGYEIVLNESYVSLSDNNATLTITDTTTGDSTQMLISGTLQIVSTTESGVSQMLEGGTDYTYTYENGVLTINLLHPGNNKYTITYTMQIINPKSGETYGNSLLVEWYGKEITNSVTQKTLTEASGSAKSYLIYLYKIDASTGSALAGATFGLYDDNDSLLASGTTDSSGCLSFQTIAGTSGLTFSEHTLYYLQEIEAPDGYILDTTKHYFYLCDDGGTDCSDCTDFLDTNANLGVTKANYLANGGTITVTNTAGYELPSTGGAGVLPFISGGFVLCGNAGYMLSRRRRRAGHMR